MELNKLHIFQDGAGPVGGGQTITSAGESVGSGFIDSASASGGKHYSLAVKRMHFSS